MHTRTSYVSISMKEEIFFLAFFTSYSHRYYYHVNVYLIHSRNLGECENTKIKFFAVMAFDET